MWSRARAADLERRRSSKSGAFSDLVPLLKNTQSRELESTRSRWSSWDAPWRARTKQSVRGDSLSVVAISGATAVLCEAISWLLIYRTNTYNSLRATIERHSRKLDSMKSTSSGGSGASGGAGSSSSQPASSRAKKMDRVESSLKDASRELSFAKLKSGAVVAAVLFVVFGLLNSLFEGRAIAKLPFAPVPLVQRMSHRGLPGNDPTDCAMVFLYFLCSMSIRTNLQKLLGFTPPRAAAGAGGGLFGMPDPKVN